MTTLPFAPEDLYGLEIDAARAEEARTLFAKERRHHVTVGDFLTGPQAPCDLVIGNPPFKHAMAFVLRALAITWPRRGTVAMLLRMNWLASQDRMAFHRENPADLFVLSRRPSFCASLKCKACGWGDVQRLDALRARACPLCGGKVVVTTSDSTEYAWFVWGPGRGGRWQILSLPTTADAGTKEAESS